jgi:hypothetical protein
MTVGVLSPLLWNIVADNLPNRLGSYISGKFISTICDLMQRALNCVQNWRGEIGQNVNADKTSIVHFTKKSTQRKIPLFFNNFNY